MDLSARKLDLRRSVRDLLLAADPTDRAAEEAALTVRFPTLPGFAAAGCVLLYASSFPEEVPTAPFLGLALDRGKTLLLPRVDRAARRLRLYRVSDLGADLRRGPFGIPEPKAGRPEVDPREVDWVLVPGLAFDPRGYRLGRGAGYYDRLLPTLRPDAPRWALAFDAQWVDALPVEPHDVPLDGIASPSRTVLRAG